MPMIPDHTLDAEKYRDIARRLRCLAFREVPFDLCRQKQLTALALGFDRFADRIEAAAGVGYQAGFFPDDRAAAGAAQHSVSGRITR